MKKYARCVLGAVVLVIGFLSFGCVGNVQIRKIDLTTDVRSSQILNLRNYGDADLDLLRQSEKLMKNGFLDTKTEEYGYYVIDYSTRNLTTLSGWYWLQAWFAYSLALLGVPSDSGNFRVEAILKIYDSYGRLVKDYRKTGSFTQTAGLYYGYNPTKRAEKELNKLFSEIQQTANMQSGEINQMLMDAGPITREKDSNATARIASNSNSSSGQTSAPVQSGGSSSGQSTAQAVQQITQDTNQAVQGALQNGIYRMSGSAEEYSFAANGNLTYKDPSGKITSGTYRIDENRLTINMSSISYFYTVTSRTSFEGNGEQWYHRGY